MIVPVVTHSNGRSLPSKSWAIHFAHSWDELCLPLSRLSWSSGKKRSSWAAASGATARTPLIGAVAYTSPYASSNIVSCRSYNYCRVLLPSGRRRHRHLHREERRRILGGRGGGFGVYADAAREPEDYLSFLVVGDWGRRGEHNQTVVAEAMGRCAELSKPAFVVSVGDNFYEGGLNSLDDPEFKQSFTDVYNHPSLQVPWHAVLGNHDYGDCGYNETRGEKECPNEADVNRSPSFPAAPNAASSRLEVVCRAKL